MEWKEPTMLTNLCQYCHFNMKYALVCIQISLLPYPANDMVLLSISVPDDIFDIYWPGIYWVIGGIFIFKIFKNENRRTTVLFWIFCPPRLMNPGDFQLTLISANNLAKSRSVISTRIWLRKFKIWGGASRSEVAKRWQAACQEEREKGSDRIQEIIDQRSY